MNSSVLKLTVATTLAVVAISLAAFGADKNAPVKWHPGHYVFIDHGPVTTEVLSLPQFRGVQKVFTWRELEPVEGRYDFSSIRATLDLVRRHHRQLVIQLTYKSFEKDIRAIPDYIQGPDYGGGVYRTTKGALNPVIWHERVLARFTALITALGREFDRDPNLEAVNLPETAPSANLIDNPQAGVAAYTEALYFEALKGQMLALRRAFPHTVVIQYTNFPPKLLDQITDFEKEHGIGMGGPDVYPRPDAINNPVTGIYRLYTKLAGTVPLGAAVQQSNYSVAAKKRSINSHRFSDRPALVVAPEDEALLSPREHIKLAREQLKRNHLFWAMKPAEAFDAVKKPLAEPDLAADPAGGLIAALPPKAFLP